MKKRARMLAGDLPRFPSLLITADGTSAQGAFAEAQASAARAHGAPRARDCAPTPAAIYDLPGVSGLCVNEA